ncbi:MAG TPA: alpha/beta fold hydrolase [Polyangiaceae bacterium]|nr:alpha/beta fold hydrolase [Polyangiaceae bacterium]
MVDQIETVPGWLDRAAFPFESRWVATSAGQVHYVDEGRRDGEVVLLVHGTPTWSFEYRHVIPVLARTRRVIAVDHLGFGLSERPRDFEYTPEAHSRVLREVVEKLGLERFALVVHDYGGPIALPVAVERPERITSLVVINSWMWPLAEDAELAKGARLAGSRLGRFLYRWLNFSLRVLMPYAYADRRKLTPGVHAQYLALFRRPADRVLVLWALARALLASAPALSRLWDARARLAGIPALLLWGLGDRALPPQVLARWRQAWPQARVQELAGVGHWPHEEAPAEVARALDEFLPRGGSAQAKLASA